MSTWPNAIIEGEGALGIFSIAFILIVSVVRQFTALLRRESATVIPLSLLLTFFSITFFHVTAQHEGGWGRTVGAIEALAEGRYLAAQEVMSVLVYLSAFLLLWIPATIWACFYTRTGMVLPSSEPAPILEMGSVRKAHMRDACEEYWKHVFRTLRRKRPLLRQRCAPSFPTPRQKPELREVA